MSSNSSSSMIAKDSGRGRPKGPNSSSTGPDGDSSVSHGPGSGPTTPPPGFQSQYPSQPQVANIGGGNAKKYQVKLKTHNRSSSHNKLHSKLASPSSSSTHLARPGLNRSKSTDGLIKNRSTTSLKRNNRSITKLSGLHPLKPTVSNQSLKSTKSSGSLKGLGASTHLAPLSGLKSSGRKGKAILRLNEDNLNDEEYEDMDNAGEKEQEVQEESPSPKPSSSPDHEDDYFKANHHDDYNGQNVRGELRPFSHEERSVSMPEVPVVDKLDKEDSEEPESNDSNERNDHRESNQYSNNVPNSTDSSRTPEKSGESSEINQSSIHNKENQFGNRKNDKRNNMSTRSSTDDFSNNLYGGSLLLSQSTGLTKKIDNRTDHQLLHQKLLGSDYTSNVKLGNSTSIPRIQSFADGNNFEPNSGISFNANPIESNPNLAEPVTTNKNVIQNNSYQPNQTIFNNLQRTNSQYLSSKKQSNHIHHQSTNKNSTQRSDSEKSENSIQNGVNNFSNFLNSNATDHQSVPHNIETRAQQRLWLQRENSLLDISNLDPSNLANFSNLSLNNLMFANNYNSSVVNQSPIRLDQLQPNQQQQLQGLFPLTPGGVYHPGGNTATNVGGSTSNGASNTPGGGQSHIADQLHMSSLSQPGMNASSTNGAVSDPHSASFTNINGLLLMAQNSHQNSIQSRTEFERLNREYLNVRRHLNPVAESLNRVEKFLHGELGVPKNNGKNRTGSGGASDNAFSSGNGTFRETSVLYQEKEQELNITINRLWQDAVVSSSSSQSPSNTPMRLTSPGGAGQSPGLINQALQMQRPLNPRVPSYNQSQSNLSGRTAHAPTTRAVKLAAQAAASNSGPKKREQSLNIG